MLTAIHCLLYYTSRTRTVFSVLFCVVEWRQVSDVLRALHWRQHHRRSWRTNRRWRRDIDD